MMTKKTYEAAAKIVCETTDLKYGAHSNMRGVLARAFRDLFIQDNPRFDQARFFKACGLESGKDHSVPYEPEFREPPIVVATVGFDAPPPEAKIESTEGKTISELAYRIKRNWKKPYFGAGPYLDAMTYLTGKDSTYGADSAKEVVLYFLSNATTWRGPEAKAVKAALKKIIGVK